MNKNPLERWTLVQALVWIDTRNEATAARYASESPQRADIGRTAYAAAYGIAAPLPLSNAWERYLAPALDAGQLLAVADCAHVNRIGFTKTAPGVVFPPAENPAMATACFLEDDKASLKPNGARFAHEFHEWQNVSFSARDIRHLWPESKLSEAYRLIATPWVCPPGLVAASLATLGDAPRVPLNIIICLLAFGSGSRPEDMHETLAVAHGTRAVKQLFLAARNGKVKLYGTHAGTGARGPIPAEAFDIPHDIAADYDCGIEPDLGSTQMNEFVDLRRDPKRARWRDVTVERNTFTAWVRELAPGPKNTAGAETKCEVWLVGKMNASLSHSSEPRAALLAKAQLEIPGLAKRSFGRAWDRAIRSTGAKWNMAGRPRNKSNHHTK